MIVKVIINGEEFPIGEGGVPAEYDTKLSETSENAVQNKVITAAMNDKADKTEIPTIPDKLPADGGNADTVNGHSVNSDVPADAKFTDTVYDDTTIKAELDNKADKSEIPEPYDDTAIKVALAGKADKSEIPTIPESLPADGGNADTVGGYSPSQLIQSNPNLLINPDFRINQRGQASYTDTTAYTVDRWCMGYSWGLKAVTPTDNGIIITISSETGRKSIMYYTQLFEKTLPEGFYTMSAKINGEVKKLSGYLEQDGILTDDWFILTQVNFIIQNYEGNTHIEWVKLEIGDVATPFIPPDPATELLKCQRYYLPFNQYIRYSSTRFVSDAIDFAIPIPIKMRTTPTLIGAYTIRNYSNKEQSGFTFTVTGTGANAIAVRGTKSGHGLSAAFLEVSDAAFDAEIY